jgi:hypothetical protein
MLPMTQRPADWARHGGTRWLGVKDETTVGFDDNQHDLPTIRFGAKLFGHTDSPLRPHASGFIESPEEPTIRPAATGFTMKL